MKAKEWGPVILLALIPALPLLVGSGLVNTRAGGDSPFLLIRVHQLVLNLRAGIFPVRWMPQAAYSLGYPFFNFYASLPYYLAAAFKLLGVGYIGSIKLTQTLGFVFAAMAIYGFSQELGHRRVVSLLVAFVYSCAPFHMVNVYVRGDSLSEFYAFVFFPLILWALLRLRIRPNVRSAAAVSLSYAGLILTHNISAFIFTPFVLLYMLWLAMPARFKLRTLVRSFLSLGTGVLLSAWFWLPALTEQDNVYLKDMTTGYFHYALHFRGIDLVQRSLLFDWAITADKQPFSMGLIQAALAAAGLIAIVVRWILRRRSGSRSLKESVPSSAFFVLLLAFSTFMITPLSRPLWDHLPMLPMVQFPWRFLSVQALATSLVVVSLIPQRQRWEALVSVLLGLVVLVSMLLGLHPERLFIHESDITTQRLMLYEYFTTNVGTTIRHDYLPRWVDPRPYTSEAFWQGVALVTQEETKPTPIVLEGQLSSAQLVMWKPTFERWTIEVASPKALLAFHTYYYPGWQAHVDGQSAQVEVLPGLGYIGLRLGQGQHQVNLQLARTRMQWVGEILSALTAIVLFIVLARTACLNRHTLRIVAAMLATLALWAIGARTLSPRAVTSLREIDKGVDLTMDFDRIPYLHHNPEGVRFGDAAQFITYALSSEAIQAGEVLTVTTQWKDVQQGDFVAQIALVSPAQHLFAAPQVIAINEQAISSDTVQHPLLVPAGTARGIYLLRLRVYGHEGEVRPVNAQGETLGTTYLLPIPVSSEVFASGNEPILQQFGERIALSHVQAVQETPGTLDITATWRVFASPSQNYKTALRLYSPSGWEVARLDTQPGYGFYPTGMWRPGELVNDCYTLSLDDGTPPGAQYDLDVTLYESASLRPIGTARIPNVTIAKPTVRRGYPVLYKFGPALALSEVQLPKTEWEQGEKLTILFKWAATVPPDRDHQCQIALLDQTGRSVFDQTVPLAAEYPTSLWPQDAIVATYCKLQLPPGLPVGQYTIALTVVETLSGSEVGSFALPTPLHVFETAHNFVIPQMQTHVGADFGGQVRLLGYDMQRTGKELLLTLHWQALAAMTSDYKVFVHLFDPATERIAAQQDVLAGGDGYPTSRWVPQEVVSNSIALSLGDVPAGTYRLAVGLYDPGGRLPIVAAQDLTVSSDRLLLGESISVSP